MLFVQTSEHNMKKSATCLGARKVNYLILYDLVNLQAES